MIFIDICFLWFDNKSVNYPSGDRDLAEFHFMDVVLFVFLIAVKNDCFFRR